MCLHFVENRTELIKSGVNQTGEPTYYPRRTPADSELDPNKTITEQSICSESSTTTVTLHSLNSLDDVTV